MPRLASPATESPATALTASGRKSGSSATRAAKAMNIPFPTRPPMKSVPSAPRELTRTAIARMIGTAARTASPARLRRRPKMIDSSERRNRSRIGAGRTGVRAGAAPTVRVSAADIEALPGQRHEHVFQTRPEHPEPQHGYRGVDQVGHHLLQRRRRPARRWRSRPRTAHRSAPAPGTPGRRRPVGPCRPVRSRPGFPAAPRSSPGSTSLPSYITPTWLHIWSTSASRWTRPAP